MGQRTPLYDLHLALGAKMVDFGGWDMPLHYGSQVEEHHQVRRDCGVFDVSHMCVVDLSGSQAQAYLQRLLANDVARLESPGKALYSAMLNEQGGVIDDLIVYLTGSSSQEQGYRLVVNAGTRDKDLAWMHAQAGDFDVQLSERRDLAMLAIQGPKARSRVAELLTQARAALIHELKPFQGLAEGDWFIARTGYTGEDGLEIVLPVTEGLSSRKRTACATSAGWTPRLSRLVACSAASRWASMSSLPSVSPGATPHTRTRGASAIASMVVADCSAAFDSVYEK